MKLENKNCAPSGLVFSNLNKIFWPKEKYTKGDVVEYHRKIAPVMLPYLKDRPESLNRHPDGATAHYWARELRKLGHEIRLMPAKDVKAYVKRNKNAAADAEAICEAVRRPTMRFVAVKSAEQQGQMMQHRTRDLQMRQPHASMPIRHGGSDAKNAITWLRRCFFLTMAFSAASMP